jgi:exopolysaccharide biosynthesis polyprenyl glycosylphosphotransferase
MFRRFSVNYALFSMGLDAILVFLSLAASTLLRPSLNFLPFAAEYPELIRTPWLVYPIFVMEWIAVFLLFSIYDGRRNLREVDEFTNLSLASALAAVASAGTLYLSYRQVSRLLFVVFVLLAYGSMLGWRMIAHLAFRFNSSSLLGKRRVLIIGAGTVGQELHQQIKQSPQFGLNVMGYLDDDPRKRASNPEILGPISNVATIIVDHHIDDVVIALPQRAYKCLNQLVGELHQLPVKVWVIPDYFRLALYKAAIEEFAGLPLLDLRAPALNDYQRMVKRAFDLVCVIITLPIVLPLMGIIALGILLTSPGPVIFSQERAGENGRLFKMVKFRTMVSNAEGLRFLVEQIDEQGLLIHKKPDDPRITPLGRFLRRTSLDELPQYYNVLKGEMSLVGPRPELPYLVARYEPWQRQRFAIPQGMTGWWQIQGRSDKPMHLNTEDDLYYIRNYSLLLDIYILVKTIYVVLVGKGAF